MELGAPVRVAVRNPPGRHDSEDIQREPLSDLRASTAPDPALLRQGKSFKHLSDQSMLQPYESIRRQVEADKAMGNKYRLVADAAKERAGRLQAELLQRELKFMPIVWL